MSELDKQTAMAVDDDAFILMDVCGILEDVGFQCLDATSADEAIPVLEIAAHRISLLFTDVEMPGRMDGFALARLVAERWSNIEIVVASGRVRPQPGDMPDKATFISKPFSAALVREHLREKLSDEQKPEPLKG